MFSQKRLALQIQKQEKAHRHNDYFTNIRLTDGISLKGFKISKGVMRPEKMTSIFFARHLFFNSGLYRGKDVLDMGCGSGILGMTMGLHGAASVVFSDIDPRAVENTKANVEKFDLGQKSLVVQSDLFEKIQSKFGVIVFNHPFFSDLSLRAGKITETMVQPSGLIHRFFQEAKKHLAPRGKIIMPYYHIAGEANDPGVQAPKNDYCVAREFRMTATTGLQKGSISIYELTLAGDPHA
jgi:tRNA G10  N-methylase Trm11